MAKKNDFWAKCRVCGTQHLNWIGSTPCCGSLADMVDDDGVPMGTVALFGSVNGSAIKPLRVSIPAK
jgi:predicted ATP-dependent serine protease